MRIVVALCSAVYSGRGDTQLPPAIRVILIKDDGAVSIHGGTGNKPLNYMGAGNVFTETLKPIRTWNFDTRQESLQIQLIQVISDDNHFIPQGDPGLLRDGTESQLQAWIAENPECLGEGFTFCEREYQTGAGAVDLLCKDGQGNHVLVEVKRVAMLGSVDQIRRYVESVKSRHSDDNLTGLIAALDVRPKTRELADKRGIPYIILPSSWRDSSSSGS
jgi:endonuclease